MPVDPGHEPSGRCVTVTFQRTPVPEWQKDPDQSGWFQAYLERQREQRATGAPASVDGEDDAEDEEEPDGRVVAAAEPVEIDGMPTSPKGFWRRLVAAKGDWQIAGQTTTTEHVETYWKSDGVDKKGVKHADGDVKRTLHRKVHMWMKASLSHEGTGVAGFVIEYEYDEGSAKPGWKLKGCQFWDMVTNERRFTTTAGEFNDWLSVFAPKITPPTKKKEADDGQ